MRALFSQDRLLRLTQAAVLLLSSLVVVVFLRFHLESSARSFREDFERQTFVELSRGETFAVARKLAALGKSEQFACISALKDNMLFFEERNGSCENGFFTVRETVLDKNHGLAIHFTLRLQQSLFLGLIAFLVAQALLASTILLSQARIQAMKSEHAFELAALAQQVAHDLKSPLAILKGLSFKSSKLEKRALERLSSLIGHLEGSPVLSQNQNSKTPVIGSHCLGDLLSTAIEEKLVEAQHGSHSLPEISLRWNETLGNTFLPGSVFEWRRIVSNLLNNAIEASEKSAQISVSVARPKAGFCTISIQDAGRGMTEVQLSKFGARGFTEGKRQGKGLGVFLARQTVENAGGRLSVFSAAQAGTTVTLEVPVLESAVVVMVDDDEELAKAWSLLARKKAVTVRHFSNLRELLAAKDGLPRATPVYLDMEIPGETLSTLDVGQSLKDDGFTQLHICTGLAPSSFSKPLWAASVVGKDPPWL